MDFATVSRSFLMYSMLILGLSLSSCKGTLSTSIPVAHTNTPTPSPLAEATEFIPSIPQARPNGVATPDLSDCLHVPITTDTLTATPNANNLFGSREPDAATTAPDGACLEISGKRVIKHSSGTQIYAAWYLVWNPTAHSMVFKGDEWAALEIDSGWTHFVRRDENKLYFVDSVTPVLQDFGAGIYTALVNLYEFVD